VVLVVGDCKEKMGGSYFGKWFEKGRKWIVELGGGSSP